MTLDLRRLPLLLTFTSAPPELLLYPSSSVSGGVREHCSFLSTICPTNAASSRRCAPEEQRRRVCVWRCVRRDEGEYARVEGKVRERERGAAGSLSSSTCSIDGMLQAASSSSMLAYAAQESCWMRLSARSRESANCAARSVTLKRGGGKALVGEQGETERELSLVPVVEVVEVRVGEMGAAKVKLESNIFVLGGV